MPDELLPVNLEIVKTKSGRKVLKRKDQQTMTVEELHAKGQKEARKYLQSLGKVTFI